MIWGLQVSEESIVSTKVQTNNRLKQISFEAAEYALRVAEEMVVDEINTIDDIVDKYNGVDGRYSSILSGYPVFIDYAKPPAGFNRDNPDHWLNPVWGDNGVYKALSSIVVTYNNDANDPNSVMHQPRFIVEYVGRDLPNDVNGQPQGLERFKITAIGWGPKGMATSVVRSYVGVSL